MRRIAAALVLLLALAGPCRGQTVELPAQLTIQFGTQGKITAKTDGASVAWIAPDYVTTADGTRVPALSVTDGSFFGGDSKRALVSGTFSGKYRLYAVSAKGDKVSEPAVCVVTVVGLPPPTPGPGPGPTPPTPGPGPGPTPPTPGPGPGPAPIPDAGLHILITYDPATETALPKEQQSILFGAVPRQYMNAKCAQVAGKPDWGIWPTGADASAYPSAPLKALYARPRQSVPWVAISSGGSAGFEGPLPKTLDEFMKLLQKFGG